MPYTPAGVFYASTSTEMSIADITKNFAENVDSKIDILQTVSAKTSTTITTNSTSAFTPSGLSATITPISQSSKIITIATLPFRLASPVGGIPMQLLSFNCTFSFIKNSTSLQNKIFSMGDTSGPLNSYGYLFESARYSYTDTHNTLSPITYSLGGRCGFGTGELKMNYARNAAAVSTMLLLEVA